MKRLPLNPNLVAKIKVAVGQDVDPSGFAVFEAIAVNSLPLPGKDGSIFENAQISPLTLRQMVDSVQGGNHLPLIMNHDMSGVPVGRVFHAELHSGEQGEMEVRVLFYIDNTNDELAAKIDAGSLDEVSVQFLATQLMCSECGFDYRGEESSWENIVSRTCNNGHEVGKDGVHIRLVGLQAFTELSLVTRGAANNPKIVGKSQSKLAAPLQALAARGFEVDELFCTASRGELNVDLNVILAQLNEKTEAAAVAKAEVTALTAKVGGLEADLATAKERIASLEASEAANVEALNTELANAKTFLGEVFTKLATAAGETEITVPETIADLKAGIEAHQSKLTAMIPVGGAAASTQTKGPETGSKFNASAASAYTVTR